jgi:hypothetical protein
MKVLGRSHATCGVKRAKAIEACLPIGRSVLRVLQTVLSNDANADYLVYPTCALYSYLVAYCRISMRSCRKQSSPLLGSRRFATALLALTSSSSSLSASFSSAFTPNTRAFLPSQASLQLQSQSQPLLNSNYNSNWQQLQRGSLSMSTTAEAPAKTTSDSSSNMSTGDKLDALRRRMKELGLDVYLVPPDDPDLSGTFLLSRSFGRLYQYPSILSLPIQISLFAFTEYVPEAYMRRGFLTGFTGSAGTALITAHDAHL